MVNKHFLIQWFGKRKNWTKVSIVVLFVLILLMSGLAFFSPEAFVVVKDVMLVFGIGGGVLFFLIKTLVVNTDGLIFRERNFLLAAKILEADYDPVAMISSGFYKMRKITMQLGEGKSPVVRLWVRPLKIKQWRGQPTKNTYFDGDVVYYHPTRDGKFISQCFQDKVYQEEELLGIFDELITAAEIVALDL